MSHWNSQSTKSARRPLLEEYFVKGAQWRFSAGGDFPLAYTRVKTHNLLQVVNRPEQYCSEQAWTVLYCTLWTLLSTVLFRPARTALFRADEPTGVNNAVLTVHIKHDINPVLCCQQIRKRLLEQHISCLISVLFTYDVEYIICFSFTVYVIISCIIARNKNTQYILQKIYYWRQMIIH